MAQLQMKRSNLKNKGERKKARVIALPTFESRVAILCVDRF